MTYDAVVVGAGLAGLTAALRLVEADRRVLVLAKGVGSLHLGGHVLDVLGYAPDRVESPSRALPAFVATHPDHPYARLPAGTLDEAVAWLISRFPSHPLHGSLEENLLLPTAVGVPKPSAVAPASLASGDLRRGGPVLFVGFRALKDFYPAYLAGNVRAATAAIGLPVEARAVELALTVEGEADVSTLDFARRLDRDLDFRKALLHELEPHLGPGDRVGLPALLGVDEAIEVRRDLQDGLGCEVFEVATLPPSVPGIRLYGLLKDAVRRRGGRFIENTPVIGIEAAGRSVEAVVARSAARPVEYRGRSFVLASGGFASRGLEMDSHGRVRETAFALPVAGVPAAGRPRFVPAYFEPQPMAAAGVAVDDRLRPVDGGRVIYENVRVAGATVAGAEPWREKSGNGIALATGYRAATLILEEEA